MSYPRKILEGLKEFKEIYPDATLQEGIEFIERLVNEAEGEGEAEETVDCPIHGKQIGSYCPRC